MTFKKTLLALAIAAASAAALADIRIGVSLALTGPGSGLGIPMQKQLELFPKTIAGEKVILEILDDATDPGKGAANARRFVTEDKVDVIFGSCITAVAAAMTDIAAEAGTNRDDRNNRADAGLMQRCHARLRRTWLSGSVFRVYEDP